VSIRDLHVVTGDERTRTTFESLCEALACHIGLFDTGEWTLYSLREGGGHIAPRVYHDIHVVQAWVLAQLTGDERWKVAGDRWYCYRQALADRTPLAIWWDDLRRRATTAFQRVL
jgi:hypothetical protein